MLSQEVVIRAIQDWAGETGAPPRAQDWMLGRGKWAAEYPRWPALHQVQAIFPSWNSALSAAGFTPRNQRWLRDDILEAARVWAERHGGD